MTEPIPLWEDWRFWQIVVTGALAFLGFTFGTWVKYGFDLRRDRLSDAKERTLLANRIQSEMAVLAQQASNLQGTARDLLMLEGANTVASVAILAMRPSIFVSSPSTRLGLLEHGYRIKIFFAQSLAAHVRDNVEGLRAHGPDRTVKDEIIEQFVVDLGRTAAAAQAAVDVLAEITGDSITLTTDAVPDAPEVPTK